MSNVLARMRARRTLEAFRAASAEPEPCHGDPLTAAAGDDDVVVWGPTIPVGIRTGDGRLIEEGAITWDLEVEAVPIKRGHEPSDPIVGVLDQIAEVDGEQRTVGRLFPHEDREELLRLIENNAIGWSVGLDDMEATRTYREPEIEETEDGGVRMRITREQELVDITGGRLRHLAFGDTSAYREARPRLGMPPADYMTGGAIAAAARVATYPDAHFELWEGGKEPTPLHTTPDGRVIGQIAGDGVCFRNGALDQCTKYTSDPDPKLRHFHSHTLTTDSGEVIRVGALVAGTLHASTNMSLQEQRQHHENTSRVWALVRAFEDSRGRLCVTGSVIPGLDPAFLAQASAAPVSIERWPVHGVRGTTLVGAVSVVSPAWPVLDPA